MTVLAKFFSGVFPGAPGTLNPIPTSAALLRAPSPVISVPLEMPSVIFEGGTALTEDGAGAEVDGAGEAAGLARSSSAPIRRNRSAAAFWSQSTADSFVGVR